MKEITSRTNTMVKHICSLHTSKGRREYKQCIGQGLRTCQTMLNGGYALVQIYVTEKHIPDALSLCSSDQITHVTQSVMEKISTTHTPSGILALFTIPDSRTTDQLSSGIVLAQLTNPGNVGTLIRTCAGMNYRSVVCIDGVDPWSPKVIQASAGTIALVHIFQWSWHYLLEHKDTYHLVALVVRKGLPLKTIKYTNVLLVIGNEADGIPSEWVADCDQTVTLEMSEKTESLNAAVAGSIALYIMATQGV